VVGSLALYGEATGMSVVAHELRAPLTALAATSEVLDRDLQLFDGAQLKNMVLAIRSRTLGLQALVENLLYAGSIDGGRFRIQTRVTDLRQTCLEAADLVQPILARRGQSLRLPRKSVLALVDDRRIVHALVNLIVNAGKFSPPNTSIEVAIVERKGKVRLTISDRGPGFAGSGRVLFEPYAQERTLLTDGLRGVGLGLAIVRSIVEAHGGRVGARHRRGGGSQFWFELSSLASANDGTTPDGEMRQTA